MRRYGWAAWWRLRRRQHRLQGARDSYARRQTGVRSAISGTVSVIPAARNLIHEGSTAARTQSLLEAVHVGPLSHCAKPCEPVSTLLLFSRCEGGPMGNKERRNIRHRAAVVQKLINSVITNPSVTLTVDTLQAWLSVPGDAAERILGRLAASGVVREVQHGVWVPAALPGFAAH